MEEQNKKKLRNYAFVEGFLREADLKEGLSNTGKTYISGNVTVSINRYNSQRVHVFAFATKFDGSENKAFKSLKALLGDNITTIASYVSNLPQEADLEALEGNVWDAAAKVATKVWFSGSLEEYATITVNGDKEIENSSFSFRANNGGIRQENGKRAFNPRDNVELDGSIIGIHDEQKRDDNDTLVDTGRLVVDYIWIDYRGTGHKFKLIAPNEPINPKDKGGDTFADYIRANYEVGQTALFNVAIVNLAKKEEEQKKTSSVWGQVEAPSYTTKFVHELRIFGGRSVQGIGEGEDNYVEKSAVTDAITKRRVAAKENHEKAQARKNSAPKVESKGFGAPSSSSTDAFSGFGDLPDF